MNVTIVECPRDAMQGIKEFIPTSVKAEYINLLLKCGFNIIDFGSFVSPRYVPQMKDTAELVKLLDMSQSNSELLSIVLNERGAIDACKFSEITYLGFPFSVSEEFQKRNANASREQSLLRVEQIQEICKKNSKILVVYLSMAFGNPYNEPWGAEEVAVWAEKLSQIDVTVIPLADTVGVANPDKINRVFSLLTTEFPEIEFGAHFHTRSDNWNEKLEAAFSNGCKRFEGAIKGFGGCPMAKDDLVGNMATENIITFLQKRKVNLSINQGYIKEALIKAEEVFPK